MDGHDEGQEAQVEEFERFERKHSDPLYRHLRGLGLSECDASDMRQEIFLAAWRVMDQKMTVNRAWLLRRAGWLVSSYRRRLKSEKRRRKGRAKLDERLKDVTPTRCGTERVERAEVVHQALNRLPPKYRDAIAGCIMGDRSPTEWAAERGVSSKTVGRRINRGLSLLRDDKDLGDAVL